MLTLLLIACAPVDVAFTVTLANVSAPDALQPSDGTTHDIKFAPGLLLVHDEEFSLFAEGAAASQAGLEALAEDGDPTAIVAALEGVVTLARVISDEDDVTYQDAPMLPGRSVTANVDATSADFVTIVFMYGESNDVFIANETGIPVWVDGALNSGEWASELSLWDAGTEVNEEPGVGSNQAPRQDAAGQGTEESGVIARIDGDDASGYAYPAPTDVVSLVVEARELP